MVKNKDAEHYKVEMTNTDRVNVMVVCINGIQDNLLYGNILNCDLKEPIAFKGLDKLILAIDEVCERVGYPLQNAVPRFLNHLSEKQYLKLALEKEKGDLYDGKSWMNPLFHEASSAKEIVVVQVMFRQNSSMQGRILCSHTNKKYVAFRSALELMRMFKEIEEDLCR